MAQTNRKSPMKLPALIPPATAVQHITTGTPVLSWVTVTPELAMNWIDTFNTNNRKLREDHVARLAADMIAGKWRGKNGEPIKFDTEGRMFEGQHRCWACVQAGVPFETLLITGCDPDDYSTSGIGRPKNFADFLGPVHGEKNVYMLASVLKLIWQWGRGTLGTKSGREIPTIPQLEEMLRDHPNVRNSVDYCKNQRLLNGSYAALIHYAGTLINRSASVEAFLDRLQTGLGLMPDDPAYHLRKFLLSQKQARPGHRRAAQSYVLALAIKAWNASKDDKKMTVLRFVQNEEFPQL